VSVCSTPSGARWTGQAGESVRIVEHDDTTRQPRPGGCVFAAKVTQVTALYVTVTYEDVVAASGMSRQFWLESGWSAWDGGFYWRLEAVPQ
jgi:hypothetical protein